MSNPTDPAAPELVDAAPNAAGNAAFNERAAREAAAQHDREVREAYDKGRRDEKASRRSHPFLAMAGWILAAVGAVVLAISAYNGSFSRGGQVVDQNLAVAADRATPVVQDAANQAGAAVDSAGHRIANQASTAVSDALHPAPAPGATVTRSATTTTTPAAPATAGPAANSR